MLSNDLKSKINKLWDKFWSRGITNPITAIEQISYLLFLRRIDDTDKEVQAHNKKHKTIFVREKLDENGKPLKGKNGKVLMESAAVATDILTLWNDGIQSHSHDSLRK